MYFQPAEVIQDSLFKEATATDGKYKPIPLILFVGDEHIGSVLEY